MSDRYAVVYHGTILANYRRVHSTHRWLWRARMEATGMNNVGMKKDAKNDIAATKLGIPVSPHNGIYVVEEIVG